MQQSDFTARFKRYGLQQLLLVLFGLAILPASVSGFNLVEDGAPQGEIVIPADAPAPIQQASAELSEHIEAITGVSPPVVEYGSETEGTSHVYLGSVNPESYQERLKEYSDDYSAFGIFVEDQHIHVVGNTSDAVLFAVYEMLEQLGVRWYMPGELGRVLPDLQTISWERGSTFQKPSFEYRVLQALASKDDPWNHRLRLGGERRATGQHGIQPMSGSKKRLFEENPELFSLVDGRRVPRQVCLGNEEALELAIEYYRKRLKENPDIKVFGLGPNDGGGFCECELCVALDSHEYDPFGGKESMTDRYIYFFNGILEGIEDLNPDIQLAFYAYHLYQLPPRVHTPDPRIIPVFAPITLDRIHSMTNPLSPDRSFYYKLLSEWKEFGVDIYERGYYSNLASVQLPFSLTHRMKDEVPIFHDMGIIVRRVEVVRNSWGTAHTPMLYIAAKLMWDHSLDVDETMREFAHKFFGPAGDEMEEYFFLVDRIHRDTPHFSGGSYTVPLIFTPEVMEQVHGLFAAASQEAEGHEPYAERVRIFARGVDYLQAFLDMLQHRNEMDFEKSHAALERTYEIGDELVAYALNGADWDSASHRDRSPRLLHWEERSENGSSYLNRFWSQPVKSGYKRAVTDGEIIAKLPAEWDFLTDPGSVGEMSSWYRDGEMGGNWQKILAYPKTWGDQGHHYYLGDSWYRSEFHFPEGYEGKDVFLWVGGVDRIAEVWINGVCLGTNHDPGPGLPGTPGVFRAFDLDASKVVRPGSNTIAMKITRTSVAELGTGGLMGPVMLWTPTGTWSPRERLK